MAFPHTLAGLTVCAGWERRASRGRCGFASTKPTVKAARVLVVAVR
ncbi:MAG: hypothetical protein PHE17_11590 [Thiothrix sp.]|nr:hypothetical protein [Thiothrix sp.]MDD5393651.1 hypothetical protein [Thiothrix sp.]